MDPGSLLRTTKRVVRHPRVSASVAARRLRRRAHPRRVELVDCSLYCEVAGKGEPLILVHGMTGSTRSWLTTARLLSGRFQVYVVDLVGFGRTRGRRLFRLSEAAASLEQFMDQLGIQAASLVGHSMGAVAAADLAATRPERVRRLVMVAPPITAAQRPVHAHARELMTGLAALPLMALPTLIGDIWRAGPTTLWRAARDLLSLDAYTTLSALQTPTLLIWGEHDTVVPAAVGQRLDAMLPHSELLVMSDAGHAPMWDRPRQFSRAVSRFLESDGGYGAPG